MSEFSETYGSWPSPISAGDVARGVRRPAFPTVAGNEIWWEESRPDEGGRTTLLRRNTDGTVTELLPPPWSVGTRVHEYGGRAHLPVPRRDDKAITRMGVVFANSTDQRLYLIERHSEDPVPLTPEPDRPNALRYADPALSTDGKHLLCVQEHHTDDGVHRSLVSVPLSGRGAQDPRSIRELASGAHFYASPTPSPDGRHLAYVRWNHPRMPWDGTELRVGTLTENGLTDEYTLKGGVDESVISPTWADDTTLYLASDWPGFWNLYQAGLTGQAIALHPAEEEFHTPPGHLGHRSFQLLDSGRILTLHGHTDMAPSVYDPHTLDLTPVSTELTTWSHLHSDGKTVVAVASAPDTLPCVVHLDPDTHRVEILHHPTKSPPETAYLPVPLARTFPGRHGAPVHATVYPPTHPDAHTDGPAPYVVWAHGGPVSHSTREADPVKAYFTSRGIGIIDVNYGGSTGHGRTYRKRLHKEWGIVDVEDCVAAARALVDEGTADPERLAIRGPSAGGYTALLALTQGVFACGVSHFGVTDLLGFSEGTHDYESRFLDTLVGPLPGFAERHRERSPVERAADIDVPVLLLQGLDDTVVTPDQAHAMATALARHGVSHALLEFEGEGHGFTGEKARTRSLEAELSFYGEVFGFTPDTEPIELTTDPPAPRAQSTAEIDTAANDPEQDELPEVEPLPEITPEPEASTTAGEPGTQEATGDFA